MIYSIKTLPINREVYTVDRQLQWYTVVKFDGWLNIQSIYKIKRIRGGLLSCPCYQGKFGECRHRPVILMFDVEQRTNKRWFYDYDKDRWYLPIDVGRL